MAQIERFERGTREHHSLHDKTYCEFFWFDREGKRFLQLDTFGSKSRKLSGKVSQSIQVDRKGAKRLLAIIQEAYPDLD